MMANQHTKSLGQLAYEEDVRRQPNYHDHTPRPPWEMLPAYAQHSWERNPTPRVWRDNLAPFDGSVGDE